MRCCANTPIAQRLLHQLGGNAILVRQQTQAVGVQNFLDEHRNRAQVALFVDKIGGQDHGNLQFFRRRTPVQPQAAKVLKAVELGVVSGEAKRTGIVVQKMMAHPGRQSHNARQTQTAADFQSFLLGVHFCRLITLASMRAAGQRSVQYGMYSSLANAERTAG